MDKSIEDLPDEILEYIFSLVSPYRDLQSCKLVNKKWCSAVRRVVKRRKIDLYRAIKTNTLRWHSHSPQKIPFRYSQASCYLDGIVYIFGGCSSGETTFNDLLTLDLTQRTITRVISTGSIPSPKASSTLCTYKDKLILFGGWTYPSRFSVHAPLILYKELHVFDTTTRTWTAKAVPPVCPPCAGHTATVHGSKMVAVGGLDPSVHNAHVVTSGSNVVSYLDLETWEWAYPEVGAVKPDCRFGHSQIYIDAYHLLIIGGSRDSLMPRGSHDDVWLLEMNSTPWRWKSITIQNPQWSAPLLWCNPVTRVDNLLVVLGRCATRDFVKVPNPDRENRVEEREENVNGRHGSFSRSPQESRDISPGRIVGSSAKRQKQLEALAKFEKIFSKNSDKKETKPKTDDRPRMNLYSADISQLLTKQILTWQEPRYNSTSPSNRILYSLVAGNGELVIYGGMTADTEDPLADSGPNTVVQTGTWFGVPPLLMP